MIGPEEVATLARCIEVGGVAVFPSDTVYGLACEPDDPEAVRRLYALKRRRPDKPAAVMFFDLELALAALPELGPRTAAALRGLLPGPVTLLVPNPAGRFPLAGTGAPSDGAPALLGVRVPVPPPAAAALAGLRWPVLQTSANLAGGPDAHTIDEVPPSIRRGADLVLDGGPLPGTPSTVVDLGAYEATGKWSIVRQGALARERVARVLDSTP